jgi:hypothetical protein
MLHTVVFSFTVSNGPQVVRAEVYVFTYIQERIGALYGEGSQSIVELHSWLVMSKKEEKAEEQRRSRERRRSRAVFDVRMEVASPRCRDAIGRELDAAAER